MLTGPDRRALPVYGRAVDGQTRCVHWHGPLDVVALRLPCCDRFYPCRRCHDECADHPARRWPASASDEVVAVCGVCGTQMTAAEYLRATGCPRCGTPFNPRCALHRDLYFEPGASSSPCPR